MARFKLGPDERLVSTHDVSLVDGRSSIPAKLLLTTTRLVIAVGPRVRNGWIWWLGLPVLFALRALAAEQANRVLYQIRRERFASVEPGDGGLIVFHDTGEGYAHVSFAITRNVLTSDESMQTWQQRMHTWAAGERAGGAVLPTARVVDRND